MAPFLKFSLAGILPAVVKLHQGAGLTDEAIARCVILRRVSVGRVRTTAVVPAALIGTTRIIT